MTVSGFFGWLPRWLRNLGTSPKGAFGTARRVPQGIARGRSDSKPGTFRRVRKAYGNIRRATFNRPAW